MFGLSKKVNVNTTSTIDIIEKKIYEELKPYGFTKHGRTLHRFVDGDISQAICFQCGQAYRNETHLMYVYVGIRVPECVLHSFAADKEPKKYYHEYECNIRSCLGTVKGGKQSCYDLRKNTEKIIADISTQIRDYVLPTFEVLKSRDNILKERRNYKDFDILNCRLILLEEAMIYGKMGNLAKASELFNSHYSRCVNGKHLNPNHIEYLEKLATQLNVVLEK